MKLSSKIANEMSVKEYISTAARRGRKAVAITDICSVKAFPEAMQIVEGDNLDIKIIYGMEILLSTEDADLLSVYHVIVLAKNKIGLQNLYNLVTLLHTKPGNEAHSISKEILEQHREGLLVGAAGLDGQLIQAIASHKSEERLLEIAAFYDYLEIQPDDDLCDTNIKLVELAAKINKSVVAADQGIEVLQTTDEMLKSFSYLGEKTAYDVVINNPQLISDMIDRLRPIPEGIHLPVLPEAEETVKNLSYEAAHRIYGQNLPAVVKERLDKELSIITRNGYSSLYLISRKLADKTHGNGYSTTSRGSVGSSLVANLLGITDINPLPPHWRCPKCKHSEFATDNEYVFGADLPDQNCPICGEPLIKDGWDMSYAVFLGFDGRKIPDIDICYSAQQIPMLRSYIKEILGENNVFKPGIINIPSDTGVHPAALMLIPQDMDVHCFTPTQYISEDTDDQWLTTYFDYRALLGDLIKLDMLPLREMDFLKKMEDSTNYRIRDISLSDAETLSCLCSLKPESFGDVMKENKGTSGQMGIQLSKLFYQIMSMVKPSSMNELVKIIALASFDSGAWNNNTELLLKDGVCTFKEVIATRDDIMTYLIGMGIEPMTAVKIMEAVRKGRGIKPDMVAILKEHNIPDWYIDSCQKIRYLVSRAQAIDYTALLYRMVYYKVHYPKEYQQAYIDVYAE
ncbi:PHP domain-containing protein [Anaerovibrio lipolyticus]|uniref:PHP domain-containing protein n=1 Tax=Anaerovibrio lipolyticus TaxID=82374 RepID=UPI000683F3CB|nr:PHP domain-containing protein [Anaerovibrio lipolyticus]